MDQQTLEHRVEVLERKVDSLEKLPARMDSLELQIVQFRQELGVEFSAVRTEMRALEERLRAEIIGGDEETRREMRALEERLRAEITAGDKETQTLMRALHEDVISRIALLGEDGRGRMRKRPSKKH